MEPCDDEWVAELRHQLQTSDPFTGLYAMIQELKPRCEQIVCSLPPDQRAAMLNYLHLLQKKEVWISNLAYDCGVQVGQHRAEKH